MFSSFKWPIACFISTVACENNALDLEDNMVLNTRTRMAINDSVVKSTCCSCGGQVSVPNIHKGGLMTPDVVDGRASSGV